jgi:hypothetical protein
MNGERMGQPFYRSNQFINTVAVAVGIIAILIFASANILNIYAYNIHPTETPTATPTPTITFTPRPTATRTVTPTITPDLSATITPTYLPAFTRFSDLIRVLFDRGYLCTAAQSDQSSLELVCGKDMGGIAYRLRIVVRSSLPMLQQISLEPYTTRLPETGLDELIWLTQIPFNFPWLDKIGQSTTAAETIQPTNTGIAAIATAQIDYLQEVETWIRANQRIVNGDDVIQSDFGSFSYAIGIVEGNLLQEIVGTRQE